MQNTKNIQNRRNIKKIKNINYIDLPRKFDDCFFSYISTGVFSVAIFIYSYYMFLEYEERENTGLVWMPKDWYILLFFVMLIAGLLVSSYCIYR